MIENLLSNVDTQKKIEIAKYATVFAGGIIVGFTIKKLYDSYDLGTIKDNLNEALTNVSEPKESVDLDEIVEDYK